MSAKKIIGMISRVVVQTVDDSGAFQLLKVTGLGDEVREKIIRLAQYGFASFPPPGSDGVGVAVGGSREALLVVATDSKGRKKNLLAGEATIYNSLTGESILLKSDGTILLGEGASDPVVRKSDLDAFVAKYNTHTHTGVTTGPGSSGPTAATHTGTASSKVLAK